MLASRALLAFKHGSYSSITPYLPLHRPKELFDKRSCWDYAKYVPQSACNDGIEGIDGNGVVCCPLECGQCAGTGCTNFGADFGLGSESCCGGGVKDAGNYCDVTGEAPCIYGSPPEGECSGGIEGIDGNGVVCCPLECGQCGGTGCSSAGAASGLGSESCCESGVDSSGRYCDVTGEAPCIYGSPDDGENRCIERHL
ncbi:unnamed protein product [Ectocarpus sp. CCAP 1310/34]|nr:unnamed protein product [Ectocarpus sp. CCAP 1310/34]